MFMNETRRSNLTSLLKSLLIRQQHSSFLARKFIYLVDFVFFLCFAPPPSALNMIEIGVGVHYRTLNSLQLVGLQLSWIVRRRRWIAYVLVPRCWEERHLKRCAGHLTPLQHHHHRHHHHHHRRRNHKHHFRWEHNSARRRREALREHWRVFFTFNWLKLIECLKLWGLR